MVEKKDKIDKEIVDGIKQINAVRIGELEIHSSTAGLDKVVKSMRGLIKDYDEYCNLRIMDRLKRGVGGIG
jgi:hypothetical protein